MKTTGEFTTRSYNINVNSLKSKFNLIPFGDVHFGAAGFSHNKWKDFIHDAKEVQNPIFIGMGDYMDFVSSSERRSLRNAELHDSTKELLDTVAYKQIREFQNEIKWMTDKGLFLGLIGGNHSYTFDKTGMTSEQRMCQNLNVPFLGVCTLIRIKFKHKKHTFKVDIYAHHGVGGGQTAGAPYNKLENISKHFIADIYLMGHDHGRGAIPGKTRLVLDEDSLGKVHVSQRTPYFARTGSFLKSYEEGVASYIVDGAYSPSSLGTVMFEFGFRVHQDDTKPKLYIKSMS